MVTGAGASARQEAKRRTDAREKRVRKRHPRLGGIILALSQEPQTTRSWDIGAVAEETVGAILDALERVAVLHDRIVPGRSRANIDHIVITPGGVLVIDTKSYKGRIQVSRSSLRIGGRDKTKLVDGVQAQATALGPLLDEITIETQLCFVGGDFPLLSPSRCRGTTITGTRGLRRHIKKLSAVPPTFDVVELATQLDSELEPAT